MSGETARESHEVFDGLSYADTLRELSARYQVKPEEVTAALDDIKGNQSDADLRGFEHALFRLEMLVDDAKQQVAVTVNHQTYTFDVIPYSGRVRLLNRTAQFNALRSAEQPAPTAVPSRRDVLSDVAVRSFMNGLDDEDGIYGVSPSEPDLVTSAGMDSVERPAYTGAKPESFRDRAKKMIEEGDIAPLEE